MLPRFIDNNNSIPPSLRMGLFNTTPRAPVGSGLSKPSLREPAVAYSLYRPRSLVHDTILVLIAFRDRNTKLQGGGEGARG